MGMKILIFGNPLVEKDNLAVNLIPKLKQTFPKITFKHLDPTEDLASEIENNKLTILDVVEGINKPIIITNIEQLSTSKIYSMHDFDLAFNLKLLQKIGKLKEIEIIGLPMEMDKEEAFEEVREILENQNFKP